MMVWAARWKSLSAECGVPNRIFEAQNLTKEHIFETNNFETVHL